MRSLSGQVSLRPVPAAAKGVHVPDGPQALVPLAEQQADPDAQIGGIEAHDTEVPVAATSQPAAQGQQLGHGGPSATTEHRVGVVDLQATGDHQLHQQQVEGMEAPGPERAVADRCRTVHGGLRDSRGAGAGLIPTVWAPWETGPGLTCRSGRTGVRSGR